MTRRTRMSRFTNKLALYVVTGLLGLTLLGAMSFQPKGPAPTKPPRDPQPLPKVTVRGKTPANAHPMDKALKLITESKQKFSEVRDYTCTLVKDERIRGSMQRHIVDMRVRNEPFSVYMKWQSPQKLSGQQACYVAGRNPGKMRVRGAGVKGIVGWVTLSLDDPRVRANSNRSIAQAGLANLYKTFEEAYRNDKRYNKTKIRVGEYIFAKRRVIRVETVRMAKIPGPLSDTYRGVLYFDKETLLPARLERYSWPTEANPKGEALEIHSFLNLQTNVNLPNATFNH